jgi:hypothetical protein
MYSDQRTIVKYMVSGAESGGIACASHTIWNVGKTDRLARNNEVANKLPKNSSIICMPTRGAGCELVRYWVNELVSYLLSSFLVLGLVQYSSIGRREWVQYCYQWRYSEVKNEQRTITRPEVVMDDAILIAPDINSYHICLRKDAN